MTRAEKDELFYNELSPKYKAACNAGNFTEANRIGYLVRELDSSPTIGE